MKLILKEYLSSLKERDELDAVIPDLLSQLGFNVYSRPGRGTRQYGVDVAAVGSLDKGEDKVYLFSIKPGDLTRSSWDAEPQSLRPSINEVVDFYVPNCIPDEHKHKEVVICLCFGGEVQEQVRPQFESYITETIKRHNIYFEEWNGDKIASLILSSFLNENLLKEESRSELRKSLALLDEPETSYKHFSVLLRNIIDKEKKRTKDRIIAIRQINICLWILFSWSRDKGNTESAYLSAELALLHSWEISKKYIDKKTKIAEELRSSFRSTLIVYLKISSHYLKIILPHTSKLHALSYAVRPSCNLDVNLKMFDVLGRLAMGGLWSYWSIDRIDDNQSPDLKLLWIESHLLSDAIKKLILNNPELLLPIKDEQVIDISIAVLFLFLHKKNHKFIFEWLLELVDSVNFAHLKKRQYPCILNNYVDLLELKNNNDEEFLKHVTSGSVLYPMIAFWAALLGNSELYGKVQKLKKEHLEHCNYQFWFPDESSEEHFYVENDKHGAVLSNVCIERPAKDFLEEAFSECEHSSYFNSLTAVQYGFWPLILISCRHYRHPVPLHFWEDRNDKRL